jgi:hypothetical protein
MELHQSGRAATTRQILSVHSVLARPRKAVYIALPFERSAVCGLELNASGRPHPTAARARHKEPRPFHHGLLGDRDG